MGKAMRIRRTKYEREVRKAYDEAEKLMAEGKPQEAWARLDMAPKPREIRKTTVVTTSVSYHRPSAS